MGRDQRQSGVSRAELWLAVTVVAVIGPALQRAGAGAAGEAWAQVGSSSSPSVTADQPSNDPSKGVPGEQFNPTLQRAQLVREVRALNSQLQKVDATLRSGRVKVQIDGPLPERASDD